MQRCSSSVLNIVQEVGNADNIIRKRVLEGAFFSGVPSSAWKRPSLKLLVIFSSTFTDTQLERNYLMDELLFQLRDQAKKHGTAYCNSLIFTFFFLYSFLTITVFSILFVQVFRLCL
jgi:hypothetical protein